MLHELLGPNRRGKHSVLEREPKRLKRWEIDRGRGKDEAWGFNAMFGISFCKVPVYNLLILSGPLILGGRVG